MNNDHEWDILERLFDGRAGPGDEYAVHNAQMASMSIACSEVATWWIALGGWWYSCIRDPWWKRKPRRETGFRGD